MSPRIHTWIPSVPPVIHRRVGASRLNEPEHVQLHISREVIMDESNGINPAVAEATAWVNAMVVGLAPAVANGTQYQTQSFTTFLSGLNAVHSQQQAFMVHQAGTVENLIRMLRS